MRVPDENLAEVWDRGFTIIENFLDPETLAADLSGECLQSPSDVNIFTMLAKRTQAS